MLHRVMLSLIVACLLAVAGCEKKQVTSTSSTGTVQQQPKPEPVKEPVAKPEPAKEPVKPVGKAGSLTLPVTRDARVFFHPSEADMNGGAGGRLRTSGIQKSSGEVTLMDFDRKALKAFLDGAAGKAVTATLVLAIYEAQGGEAKLEVAALDSGADWGEGTQQQVKASKGECSFLAAQTGVKPWTTVDGKEVKDLRELVYDVKAGKTRTMLNSKSADVADKAAKGTAVNLELDSKFVEHLANDANCRGIVLFNRSATAKIDVCSRDQAKSGGKLELTAK